MTQNFRCLATDGVILVEDGIVLLERNHPPHEGDWVLPGGMVERGETAREACGREVEEEVGMKVETEKFIGLYDDPGRDERGNVTAAYICAPRTEDARPKAREEAREVGVFARDSLPDADEIGFDHAEIIDDALGMGAV